MTFEELNAVIQSILDGRASGTCVCGKAAPRSTDELTDPRVCWIATMTEDGLREHAALLLMREGAINDR